MCGRYTAKKNAVDLAEEFDAADTTGDDDVREDYNVAPTKRVHIIRASKPPEDGAPPPDWKPRELTVMRWGLIPFWAKDTKIGSRMFNARSESVTTTRAFRSAVKRRRCLVPADGWYEWKKEPGRDKQPFYMTTTDGSELALAGLWEIWGEGADRITSFTILTTDAVGPLQEVHHRMPLVLAADVWDAWLDRDREDVTALLTPPTEALVGALELRPVGPDVGNVRNNGPELTERVEPEAVGLF